MSVNSATCNCIGNTCGNPACMCKCLCNCTVEIIGTYKFVPNAPPITTSNMSDNVQNRCPACGQNKPILLLEDN